MKIAGDVDSPPAICLFRVTHLFLQIGLVRLVEGVEVLAVDVENGNDLSVMQNRHHNLAVGRGRTCDMSWEVIDVGYDDCFDALPCRAADTFTYGMRVHAMGPWNGPSTSCCPSTR